MSNVTMRADVLKTLIPFISKEETRYYLRGVFFDGGILIATDGHRLAAVKPSEFIGECHKFILPVDTVLKIARIKPESKKLPLYVTFDTEKKSSTIHHGLNDETGRIILAAFPYTEVDGTYPDWRRVLPAKEGFIITAKPVKGATDAENRNGFNAKYLADFQVFGEYVSFFMNTNPLAPCIVRSKSEHFDAFGVIAAAREDTAMIPEWLS